MQTWKKKRLTQAVKEAEAAKAAMVKRMADMKANGGRRTTQGDDNNNNIEEDEAISLEDTANSVFGKQSQLTATDQ